MGIEDAFNQLYALREKANKGIQPNEVTIAIEPEKISLEDWKVFHRAAADFAKIWKYDMTVELSGPLKTITMRKP